MADSATSLETLQQRLEAYVACERAILNGHQSRTVEGTTYTRADLGRVQQAINELQYQIAQFEQPAFTQVPVRYV